MSACRACLSPGPPSVQCSDLSWARPVVPWFGVGLESLDDLRNDLSVCVCLTCTRPTSIDPESESR
eukprot:97858-Chlamydomonas_euryale.AAC.7